MPVTIGSDRDHYRWPDLRVAHSWQAQVAQLGGTVILDQQPAAELTMDEMQRQHIRAVLQQTGGRVRGRQGAAEILGMKPTTLDNRMKKLGVERPGQGFR